MISFPPNPNRGTPIGNGAFWFTIVFTIAAVVIYVVGGSYLVDSAR